MEIILYLSIYLSITESLCYMPKNTTIFQIKNKKDSWQLNAIWDPRLDPGPENNVPICSNNIMRTIKIWIRTMCRLDKNTIIKKIGILQLWPTNQGSGAALRSFDNKAPRRQSTDSRPHAAFERTEIQGKKHKKMNEHMNLQGYHTQFWVQISAQLLSDWKTLDGPPDPSGLIPVSFSGEQGSVHW